MAHLQRKKQGVCNATVSAVAEDSVKTVLASSASQAAGSAAAAAAEGGVPLGLDVRAGASTLVSHTPILDRMPDSCASDSRRCPARGSCGATAAFRKRRMSPQAACTSTLRSQLQQRMRICYHQCDSLTILQTSHKLTRLLRGAVLVKVEQGGWLERKLFLVIRFATACEART